MSDKEVALRLVEKFGVASNEYPTNKYLKFLDDIKKHKSETILGKLEDIVYWYEHLPSYSDYDRILFIDKVKNILEENK